MTDNGPLTLSMIDAKVIREAQRRFRKARSYEKSLDYERIRDTLYVAGSGWGTAPTPDEILSALDIAGFKIVRKPRRRKYRG